MDKNIQRLSLAILFSVSFFAAKAFADPAPVVQGNLATDSPTVATQALVTSDDQSTQADNNAMDEDGTAAMTAAPMPASMQNLPPSEVQLYNQLQQVKQQMRDMQGQLEVQAHEMQLLQQKMHTQVAMPSAANAQTSQTGASAKTSQATVSTSNAASKAVDSTQTKQELAEQAQYEQAYQLLVNKQYQQATSGMQSYLQKYPKGEYAANAHYWLGELNLISGNSNSALSEFKIVVNSFNQSNKVADAMLKVGYIYYLDQQYKSSATELEKLVKSYPDSSSAKLAQQKLDLMKSSGNI